MPDVYYTPSEPIELNPDPKPDQTDGPVADPYVEENVKFLRDRARVGLKKYGVGLDRTDLTADQWVQHLREELADALNYATRVQRNMQRRDRFVVPTNLATKCRDDGNLECTFVSDEEWQLMLDSVS